MGSHGPMFEKMGRDAAQHPDELVLGLLKDGLFRTCYDNQYFSTRTIPWAARAMRPSCPSATAAAVRARPGICWIALSR